MAQDSNPQYETALKASKSLKLKVSSIRDEAAGIRSYSLSLGDGGALPVFTAGAHLDIGLPDGQVRQYSLISDPNDTRSYVIAVKREENGRGGSKALHDTFKVGDEVLTSAPRNTFPLDEGATHSVLIAGGIGVTPIWSLSRQLKNLGRSWQLYYAARSRSEALFLDAFSKDGDCVHLNIDEETGALLDIAAIVAAAPVGTAFYCCGPAPMLKAFAAATAHLPEDRVHQEHFASPDAADLSGGYTVVLKRSGMEVQIPPGSTILEALQQAGLNPEFSCLAGVCSTCETTVLEGVPDHRDAVLTPSERAAGRSMMICCSGSLSPRLVLDI